MRRVTLSSVETAAVAKIDFTLLKKQSARQLGLTVKQLDELVTYCLATGWTWKKFGNGQILTAPKDHPSEVKHWAATFLPYGKAQSIPHWITRVKIKPIKAEKLVPKVGKADNRPATTEVKPSKMVKSANARLLKSVVAQLTESGFVDNTKDPSFKGQYAGYIVKGNSPMQVTIVNDTVHYETKVGSGSVALKNFSMDLLSKGIMAPKARRVPAAPAVPAPKGTPTTRKFVKTIENEFECEVNMRPGGGFKIDFGDDGTIYTKNGAVTGELSSKLDKDFIQRAAEGNGLRYEVV
jgi:hypothetical protein